LSGLPDPTQFGREKMIKKALQQFNNWRLKRKVFKKYIAHFEFQLEQELLNEKWIMECIVRREQVGRRKELAQKQSEIKEIQLLLEYFKSL
jgi:hypothetical protein